VADEGKRRNLPSPRGSLVVDVALLAVAVMWASTFSLFKIAWHDLDPVAFTGIRFAAMVLVSLGDASWVPPCPAPVQPFTVCSRRRRVGPRTNLVRPTVDAAARVTGH
jgi:hypothetical protein